MSDFKCNVLIMGKTGTGKSTLLNYICGQNVAQTGAGKPVTGEGLYEFDVLINGQNVRIFDSWGIEAGKVDRWKSLIEKSLQEHGVQKKMEDWFHSVIYCIQAGGGRVEDVDVEIIKKFLAEGYHLTIVLTKADQISEDDERQMKKTIQNEIRSSQKGQESKDADKAIKHGALQVLSTCAEKKKTRGGISEPFGREDVQKAIIEGWRDTIIDRMPKHVIAVINDKIDEWAEKQKSIVKNSSKVAGLFNEALAEDIESSANSFIEELKRETLPNTIEESLKSCERAGTVLNKTFGCEITFKMFNANYGSDNWWKQMLLGIFTFPISLPLLFSKRRIESEKEKLCELVDSSAKKIKKQIDGIEADVKKIILNALN